MSIAGDARRVRKLGVTTSDSERSVIDHAVTLWQAMHGASAPITPDTRGGVLAAICSEWVQATTERLQAGPAAGGR